MNSYKHIVDLAGATTGVVKSTIDLIVSDPDPNPVNVQEVEIGSTVSAIYLNVQAYTAVNPNLRPNWYFIVFKNPAGNLTVPDPNATGDYETKRFIIHQEMIMLGNTPADSATFPRTVFNGVIRIPRGYKRNAFGDKLQLVLQNGAGATTNDTRFCIQCIYKEFR